MEAGILTNSPTEQQTLIRHSKIIGWLEVINQLKELDYEQVVSFLGEPQ